MENRRQELMLFRVALVISFLNLFGWLWTTSSVARLTQMLIASHDRQQAISELRGSDYTLNTAVSGVQESIHFRSDDVEIKAFSPDAPIIGVVVNGQARAYSIRAFAAPKHPQSPRDFAVHVVHDTSTGNLSA
jgi:hypothetical protein